MSLDMHACIDLYPNIMDIVGDLCDILLLFLLIVYIWTSASSIK